MNGGDGIQADPPAILRAEPDREEPRKPTLRERILAADDRQFEEIWVPEWDEHVRVRGLTGAERDSYEASITDQRSGSMNTRVIITNLRAKLVALSIVDEDGSRVFSEKDVVALGGKSARALQRIFEVCQKLNALTDEDVDELTKNSNGDRSAEPGSGSRLISASP